MARVALCLLLSLISPTAFAQAPAPGFVQPVASEPDVVQSVLPNLFATSPGVTVDLHFDYSDLDGLDLTVFGVFTHVQFLTPQGMGGYVSLPFAYVEETGDPFFEFGGTGIGNLEVGGLFVTKASPRTDVLARAGVAIDTMQQEDNSAVVLATILPRLVDLYAAGFETTWGRAQVQLRHANNNLRLGAALGVDVPLAGEAADATAIRAELTGIVNAIVSAGFQQGKLGLGVSLTMMQPISDDDDENVIGLNFGGDVLMNPNVRVFFGLGFSLEDNADGTSLGVGIRSTLPI